MRYAAIAAILLAGCAATSPDAFTKTGADPEEQTRAFYGCKVQATPAVGMGGVLGAVAYRDMLNDCMRAQGYRRKE